MPHKFNADRRDKIPKQKHRVINWAEYGRVAWIRCGADRALPEVKNAFL
jgi:hypothetical protein